MRRALFVVAVGLGFLSLAPAAPAQVGFSPGFSDPFFLYYGWYLPRQQMLAVQPSTPNMIGDITAQRQNYMLNDRAGLYDPPPAFGMGQYNPDDPYSRRGSVPLPQLPRQFVNPRPDNGLPPNLAFNRTARYYPTIRSGSNSNRNLVAQGRFSRGSFGGGFVPAPNSGMGVGVPGR